MEKTVVWNGIQIIDHQNVEQSTLECYVIKDFDIHA